MLKFLALGLAVASIVMVEQATSCNEAVCGSIVSKCLLTQSCKCDLKNCTCCKDCFNCLSHLYAECCSCVDMCPKPNETTSVMNRQSHIEDFSTPIPQLFRALTEYPDQDQRWNSTTFPEDYDTTIYGPKKEIKIQMQSREQEVAPVKNNVLVLNCTVAFLSPCMSWIKCRKNCQSMGASSYRWFYDGCCECIGEYCLRHGIDESRCRECSMLEGESALDELDLDDVDEEDLLDLDDTTE